MLNNKIYQMIYSEIERFLPKEWDKLVVYLEYGENSYTFSFYCKLDGKYIKCYDIDGIDEDKLLKSYKNIDKTLSVERNKLKDKWSNMTMVIENNGKMKAEFDYTDLTECSYSYEKGWKKKYLV